MASKKPAAAPSSPQIDDVATAVDRDAAKDATAPAPAPAAATASRPALQSTAAAPMSATVSGPWYDPAVGPEPGALLVAAHAWRGGGPGELMNLPRTTIVRVLPPTPAVFGGDGSGGDAPPAAAVASPGDGGALPDARAAVRLGWVLVQVLATGATGHVPLAYLRPLARGAGPASSSEHAPVSPSRTVPAAAAPETPRRTLLFGGGGGGAPSLAASASGSSLSSTSSSLASLLGVYEHADAGVRQAAARSTAVVLADFAADGPGELSVAGGEAVLVMPQQEEAPPGWTFVFVTRDGGSGGSATGYVPTAYLDLRRPSGAAAGSTTSSLGGLGSAVKAPAPSSSSSPLGAASYYSYTYRPPPSTPGGQRIGGAAAMAGTFSARLTGRLGGFGATATGGRTTLGALAAGGGGGAPAGTGSVLDDLRRDVYRRLTALGEAGAAAARQAPEPPASPSTAFFESGFRATQQRVMTHERESLLAQLHQLDAVQHSTLLRRVPGVGGA